MGKVGVRREDIGEGRREMGKDGIRRGKRVWGKGRGGELGSIGEREGRRA